MIQDLAIAGQLLNGALDQYLSACTAIEGCFAQGNQLESIVHTLQDRLDDELRKLGSFENKLKQAKAAISSSRNYHTTFVPINTLPSEILARIFRLVLDTQSCTRHERVLFPKHPDLLSHVCSRWRQVSFRSHALWSHIDLAPCHPLHQGLLDRATVYASRAEHLPLCLHVMTLGESGQYEGSVQSGLEQFLASVTTRIGSLELIASGKDNSLENLSVLKSCINYCISGVLTQLVIKNSLMAPPSFMMPEELPEALDFPGGVFMPQPYEVLEELWRPITTLRLYGVYPYWDSAAYQGLVELCLVFGKDPNETIPESQLVAILASCPKLRVFQFDSVAQNLLPPDTVVAPIHLDHLETLDLAVKLPREMGSLLRWIVPGSTPLCISFTGRGHVEKCLSDDRVEAFFNRSNVTRARLANNLVSRSDIMWILDLSPSLHTLILDNVSWFEDAAITHFFRSRPTVNEALATRPSLDRIYFLDSRVSFDSFMWFLRRSSIQAITSWSSGFFLPASSALLQSGTELSVSEEIRRLCPIFEHIHNKPELVEHWD